MHAWLTREGAWWRPPASWPPAWRQPPGDSHPAWTDNSCSNAYTKPPPEPRGAPPSALDCPNFVISSTDATWHARDWAKTDAAVDTYFAEDWQSVRAFGLMLRGREALREFMRDWLGGFPDVFIHVADVFCEGTDTAGYKTTMPYVLTATHRGWSRAFGAPTGNAVKYHGIANCFIQRNADGQWQYTREWDLARHGRLPRRAQPDGGRHGGAAPERRPRPRRRVPAALRVELRRDELVPALRVSRPTALRRHGRPPRHARGPSDRAVSGAEGFTRRGALTPPSPAPDADSGMYTS